jgi:hypothetical protein
MGEQVLVLVIRYESKKTLKSGYEVALTYPAWWLSAQVKV